MQRDTILIVNDSNMERKELNTIFSEQFNILEAGNNAQALFFAEQNHESIAAVVIGLNLMVGECKTFYAEMKAQSRFSTIPVIAVIQEGEVQSEYIALEMGADDVISRPFYPALVDKRVTNLIAVHGHKWRLTQIVEEQQEKLVHSNEVMVDTLVSVIEYRSMESGQHILRMRRFTQILLETVARNCPEYKLTPMLIQTISGAAALHDIGKILIPDAILNKPGRLTKEEFETMKTHTTAGASLLTHFSGVSNEDYLRYAYNICRYHHERWNGAGYPDGLAGDDIPICAQVAGIADVYDALTTPRVYKEAYSCTDAANMILNGECGVFSPKLLECFKLVIDDFAELTANFADGDTVSLDSITLPLAPPERSSGNVTQYMVAKYEILLHYLNATVLEVDFDNDIYHVVYNPNPDLMFLKNANNLDEALEQLASTLVHPDDRHLLIDEYKNYLSEFFTLGLRKRSRRYRIMNEQGIYRYYEATTLRVDEDDNRRRVLVVWEPVEHSADADAARRTIHALSDTDIYGFSFACLHDRWLTVVDDCSALTLLLGYTEWELKERFDNRLSNLILPTERKAVLAEINRQFTSGIYGEVEFPMRHKDGRAIWVVMKGSLTKENNGMDYIYGALLDVSQARGGMRELTEYLGHYRYILEQTTDILFEWNIESNSIRIIKQNMANIGTSDMSESVSDMVISSDAQIHPDDLPRVRRELEILRAGASFAEFTVRIANNAGRYSWNRIRAASVPDEAGNLLKIKGMLIDVNSEMQILNAVQDNAERDSLTKLLNKETGRRQVERSLENSGGKMLSAMAIIDLDNFKEVNDTYGHLFGDTLLVRIASEISRLFRGTDVISRIGGDEFMVFMNNIPHHMLAEQRCKMLVEAIDALYEDQLRHINLSCSVGIAFTPDHGIGYQEIFRCADKALYQAKRQGKNNYQVYNPAASYNYNATMVSKNIDSDENAAMSHHKLIQYVFNRLYESGDIESTIESLLEIVGRQNNVSRVYIFENNSDNTMCSNTFEWCNEGVASEIDNLQNISYETDIPNYWENFNEQGIFYCANVSDLPQNLRDILEPQGIRSLLHCAIRDNGVFRGYVGLDENSRERLWTKEQIEILTFLSQLISIFLLKKRTQDSMEKTVQDMHQLLNNQYSWIYVVEPNTFKLKFINDRTMETVSDISTGMRCHKALMNRDTPCENCPILCKEGRSRSSIIHNDYLDLHVRSTANTIYWDGDDAWLVACRELEEDEEGV